jgi:hypothetical protein
LIEDILFADKTDANLHLPRNEKKVETTTKQERSDRTGEADESQGYPGVS